MLRFTAVTALALSLLTGCDSAGEDAIGPEGGTVISRDGRLSLEIPPGALAEATEITIEEADSLPDGAIGPSYRVLPVGTVFEAPVSVYYDYGTADSPADYEFVADDLELVIERHDEWSRLADRSVFADDSIIAGSALYLSTFGIVERSAQ